MNRSTRLLSHGCSSRGFSLVEILIAVLILALGLLGLGAVFPAVIAQQRNAVDSTNGAATAASAAATLRGGGELANWSVLGADKYFSQAQNMIDGNPGGPFLPTSLWEAEWPVSETVASSAISPGFDTYKTSGTIRFGLGQTHMTYPQQQIPEMARLSPPAFSGRDPQYVWDFVARKNPATKQVEVALFVRRVDPRIRTGRDVSLSDALAADGVFAVGVDDTGRPAPGDRADRYAVPLVLGMEVPDYGDGPVLDRIHFRRTLPTAGTPEAYFDETSTGFPTRVELASLVGQQLVDNFGVVRTVTAIVEDEDDTVEIDPPFTEQQALGGFPSGNPPGANSVDPSLAQQVIFTPQIPVSVEVFSVE